MIEHLKQIREENQMTIQEIANEIGISKGYYSMIENGKRGLSYNLAVKIAQVFNMKPDDIFLASKLTNEKPNDKEVV